MRLSRLALPLVAAGSLASSSASAHLSMATGLTPFFSSGSVVGGYTSWGTVMLEDGVWRRTCEEAGGAPFYTFGDIIDDGRIIIGSFQGLVVTEDLCNFETKPTVLEGVSVTAHMRTSVDGDGVDELILLTSTSGGAAEVYRGPLDTLDLAPTGFSVTGKLLFDLVGDSRGEGLYVAGLDTSTQAPLLLHSSDGGATFAPVGADLSGRITVRALAPWLDEDVVLATRRADEVFALEHTTEGGTNIETIATFPTLPVAVAFTAGLDYVVLQDGELWVRDGDANPFTRAEGAPPLFCLYDDPSSTGVIGCAREDGADHHFYRTVDGISFEGIIPFADVEERICPEGSPGATFCARYLDPVADGGAGDGDGDGDGDDDGDGPDGGDGSAEPTCRCVAAPGAGPGVSGLALVLGLALARRRWALPRRCE